MLSLLAHPHPHVTASARGAGIAGGHLRRGAGTCTRLDCWMVPYLQCSKQNGTRERTAEHIVPGRTAASPLGSRGWGGGVHVLARGHPRLLVWSGPRRISAALADGASRASFHCSWLSATMARRAARARSRGRYRITAQPRLPEPRALGGAACSAGKGSSKEAPSWLWPWPGCVCLWPGVVTRQARLTTAFAREERRSRHWRVSRAGCHRVGAGAKGLVYAGGYCCEARRHSC